MKALKTSYIVIGLLVMAFLIAIGSLLLGSAGGGEFGGADDKAESAIGEVAPDYEPWFTPLFEPPGEVESGLFAVQAGLGAGLVGYALGVLRTRHKQRTEQSQPSGAAAAGE